MTNLNLLLSHARRRASIISPCQTLAAFVRSSCFSSSSSSSPSSSIRRPWALADARFAKDAPSLKLASPFVACKEFCTYEPTSEGLIPPELLKSATVSTADHTIGHYGVVAYFNLHSLLITCERLVCLGPTARILSKMEGEYADLVTRVTNFQNEDKGLMVLAGDVFDVPIRKDIIHRVVRWQLAKRQQGTHSTKTISEVSGTGKKPYKQKGTGRARHGTLRGPQFRGGATMHGPKPRSHAIKLNKKVRRLGLKIALSARAAEGKLLVFEDLELPNHKTKNIVNYVSHMDTKKVLLVDGGPVNDNLKLATGNLHYVNVLPSIGLNVYSILQHDTLVMTKDAVDRIVTRMHTPIKR